MLEQGKSAGDLKEAARTPFHDAVRTRREADPRLRRG
jgi:hypothetical protein